MSVITTLDSRQAAEAMAQALVERGLVACAQIEAIHSLYRWNGALQQTPEWRLSCKTLAARYPEVASAIAQLHSYEVPAIYALPLEAVHPPYARWVAACCEAQPPKTAPAPGG